MQKFGSKQALWIIGLVVILIVLVATLPDLLSSSYNAGSVDNIIEELDGPKVTHLPTPEPLKALYMTACVASTSSWRESLKRLVDNTELNAIVIDIKDATGTITLNNEILQDSGSVKKGCKVGDLQSFIQRLHEAGIYVIGRISVFQDPYYTALRSDLAIKSASTGEVWKDYKGLSFIDVGAKVYWDHIIDISKASYEIGFDEINYDYVRYPSDGNISDIKLTWTSDVQVASSTASTTPITKSQVLKEFFSYLHNKMKGVGPKISVDLFGMTTTVTNDMGIGQILENVFPYFDYVYPMVYPSHYPKTWNGLANPAEHPYEVVKISMKSAVDREMIWREQNGIATTTSSKIRPWLQDFDLGADYDVAKVRAQIQATYDVGLTSWLVWSAANKYTENAYLPE